MAVKHKEGKIVFDYKYTSVAWITVECLMKHDIQRISRVINKTLDPSPLAFFGCSFGRHDLVVESSNESPRVASWKTLQIQKELEKMKQAGKVSFEAISCSQSICRKVTTMRGSVSKKPQQQFPLKAYIFARPKADFQESELVRLAKLVDSRGDMDLLWNSSSYNLILLLSGYCYYDMFSDLIKIKKNFLELTIETCAFFAVRWDSRIKDFCRDIPRKDNGKKLIPAITYVKLKKGANPKFLLRSNEWTPILGSASVQFRRPGWLDECLLGEKETLRQILDSVSSFREDNRPYIRYTSTIPLFPTES